jgi:hypothetical protein
MHTTTLPLGKYAKDPRFRIVQVDGADAVRTSTATIIQRGKDYQLWLLDRPTAIYAEYTSPSLAKALSYVLGDPAKVGPHGFDTWLHTDGREYAHDPATTGMKPAQRLHVGDVVDFPQIEAFEIVGESEVLYDGLGQGYTAFPVRILKGGFNQMFRYTSNDMVPVRFAR